MSRVQVDNKNYNQHFIKHAEADADTGGAAAAGPSHPLRFQNSFLIAIKGK